MYIDPFWCGVSATIIVEVVVLIIYAITQRSRRR